jgi:hypothetical protein
MAAITLRNLKGSPLNINEMDDNFVNINTELGTKLTATTYTAADILTKLKTVDGSGSLLDADLLDGLHSATANTAGTIVARDGSGNFSAGTISANINATGTTVLNGPLNTNAAVGTAGFVLKSRGAGLSPEWGSANVALASSQTTGVLPVLKGGTGTTTSTGTGSTVLSISPALTGSPTAPTPVATDNSTKIATTAYVQTKTSALGTMSLQNSTSVAITGGTMGSVAITAGSINNTTITNGTINGLTVTTIGSNASGTKTVSTLAPSGGNNGDIWYMV